MEKLTADKARIGMRIACNPETHLKDRITRHDYGLIVGMNKIAKDKERILNVAFILNDVLQRTHDLNTATQTMALDGNIVKIPTFEIIEDLQDEETDLSKKEKHEVWNSALESVIDSAIDWCENNKKDADFFINEIEKLKK